MSDIQGVENFTIELLLEVYLSTKNGLQKFKVKHHITDAQIKKLEYFSDKMFD